MSPPSDPSREPGTARGGRATYPVLLAPYLPIAETLRLGVWRLVPFGSAADVPCVTDGVRGDVATLVDAYRIPGAGKLGAVLQHGDDPLGTTLADGTARRLQTALTLGALDGNASPIDGRRRPQWHIHRQVTSENGVVVEARTTGAGTGTHGRALGPVSGMLAIVGAGAGEYRESPPANLLRAWAGGFNPAYATAVLQVLGANDDIADRVQRATELLATAYVDTDAVTTSVRLGALRTGFDTLLGKGQRRTGDVRRALHDCVEPGNDDRSRTISVKEGDRWQDVPATELEHWFHDFNRIRGKTIHGKPIPDADWLYEGEHHHWVHAEFWLCQAIKHTVARAIDDPTLVESEKDRDLRLLVERLAQRAEEDEDHDDARPDGGGLA